MDWLSFFFGFFSALVGIGTIMSIIFVIWLKTFLSYRDKQEDVRKLNKRKMPIQVETDKWWG